MEWHMSVDLFQRFLHGKATREEAKRLVRHLIHGCDECLALSSRIVAEAGFWFPKHSSMVEPGYKDAFDTALLFATKEERRAAIARVRGWGQWAGLEPLHPDERLATVISGLQYHQWGLYHALLDASRRFGRTEPIEAVAILGLAVVVAQLAETTTVGGAKPAVDLRARAVGMLGNARRLAGDLDGARKSINEAWQLLDQGTGDPLERAHLLCLDASYIRTMGEFETAESSLREALHIYTVAGDTHLQGRTLLKMGDAIGYVEPERGIAHIRQALELVDTSREPRLALCAQHDLAFFLANAGRPEEALAVLDRARPLYKQFPDDWTQLRLAWMEGKIAREFGHFEEATQAFRQVWNDFRERDLHYDVLMVSLDLAETLVAGGQHATAARFAGEVHEVLAGWQVHHYAVAAWLVLRQALELRAEDGVLDQLRRHYLRHWHRPTEFIGG